MPPAWLPHQHKGDPARLPLLCESRQGYQNLCQLITLFKMRETTKSPGAATFNDLHQYATGLICLTGGEEGPLAAALKQGNEAAGPRDRRTTDPYFCAARMFMSKSSAILDGPKRQGTRRQFASPAL